MPANVGTMFYVGQVPWHGEGVRLEALADLPTALARGGLDWTVSTRLIVVDENPHSSTGRRVAVVRDDIAPGQAGRVLGMVHPGLCPLQNAEGARIFDQLFDPGAKKWALFALVRSSARSRASLPLCHKQLV